MPDVLSEFYRNNVKIIQGRLQRAFPTASRQDVEDAISDACADLCGRSSFNASFFYMVAWRRLRGVFRKRKNLRMESIKEDLLYCAPPQERLGGMSRWLRVFEQVIRLHHGGNPEGLRRALLRKIEGGEHDTVIAAAEGLRRERLNQAWRDLIDRLLPD